MENVLQLALGTVKFPNISSREGVLNRQQCEHLLSNFQKGVQKLQNINNGTFGLFYEAEKNLFRIVNQGRMLIEECCNENWVHAIVMQLNNKEGFRELLLDFEFCFHTLCDIYCDISPHEKGRILVHKHDTTFYPTSIDVVKEDQASICTRLSKHLELCNTKDCKDCRLVGYLEQYITSLRRVEGGDVDKIIFPYSYISPDYGVPRMPLGVCIGGWVYRTNWMGLECATKLINIGSIEHGDTLWKEASILGGLNHPNIIKFMCCGINKANQEFELVMELGMTTLHNHLEAQGRLKELNAVDIMLQIASGMCYLHDMKVAHRDLKPQNVVVMPSRDVQLNSNLESIHVKLLDFGISKVEVKDSHEVSTSDLKIGTPGYMAPEAMGIKFIKVDAFKADVFSFGMMCSDILKGTKPSLVRFRDYYEYIQDSKRPELPRTYSEVLRTLVDECWSLDPLKRPTFLDIHRRLARLKATMLKGATNSTISPFWQVFSLCKSLLKYIQWLWISPQVDHFDNSSLTLKVPGNCNDSPSHPPFMEVNANNMMALSKLVGVKERMSHLEKQIQKVSSLGIVGMGGIGKTTLAKALSDHISHRFDAICFVIDLKDETCTFALKHKSRDVEDLLPQEETLRKLQDILEGVRKTKKILLVVDNVRSQLQLRKLLGDGMFKGVDGMKLIANSRDWNSLNQHVPMVGKVDMQTLEGNQPMKLFSSHAFGTNQSCLPYLEHVAKKIVHACCGLPLSLEVMGICMQGETRLRIWERTLERLLRARHDGSANEKIWKTLRITFDDLSDDEKDMFLDIACFFCKDAPTRKETFLRIMDGNAREILENLQNKSLVKVDEWDHLHMHDQLCDMGRMITETEEEFLGTRIFDLNYIAFDNHCKHKGTKLVQGLSFKELQCRSKHEVDFEFKPMEKLHILNVKCCNNLDILSAIVKASPFLKYLRVQLSTPNTQFLMEETNFIGKFWNYSQDYLQQLRVLEVYTCNFSGILSIENSTVIPLKEIHFWACQNIDTFLDEVVKFSTLESLTLNLTDLQKSPQWLTNLCALDELTIRMCKSLRHIPEGFGGLTSLKKLRMQKCEALEEFPVGLTHLSALEELNFSVCKSLRKIPEGFGGLTNLKKLCMQKCEALKEFPMGLTHLSALEELNFSLCKSLRKIPEGFGGLTSLKKLQMWKCEALEEFPLGLNNLSVLEEWDFSKCRKLRKIPEGFGGLMSLKKLEMWGCQALEEFPPGLTHLSALEELNFSLCRSLRKIPEGFGGLTSLKKLCMQKCEALEEFPVGLTHLLALEELNFSLCKSLRKIPEGFGGLTSLKKLEMWGCQALEEFPPGSTHLSALEELNFSLCRSLRKIPEGFGGLTSLKKLEMWECEALEEFPPGLNNLSILEEWDFSKCRKLRKVPEGFGGLTSLRKLEMWKCEALEEFPPGLNNLCTLEEWDFSKCRNLRKIPEGFGGLTNLKKLCMQECEALEEFPMGLTHLSALEELNFSQCRSLKKIPEGFGGLKSLKKLEMWECEALEEFPPGLNNMSTLEVWNFSKCRKLRKIPEGFGGLTSLKKLEMWECEALEEFPPGLKNLSTLEVWNFSKCRNLGRIPEGFGGLTSLKKLCMQECEALEEFPMGLNHLSALEELNFSQCRSLRKILEGFGGLTNLKKLCMQECEALEELPVGLNHLSALEELNFSQCRNLRKIPEGLGGLTSLKKL